MGRVWHSIYVCLLIDVVSCADNLCICSVFETWFWHSRPCCVWLLTWCMSAHQSIVGDNIYMPLDSRLSNSAGVVCFKSVNFGVSAVTAWNVLSVLFCTNYYFISLIHITSCVCSNVAILCVRYCHFLHIKSLHHEWWSQIVYRIPRDSCGRQWRWRDIWSATIKITILWSSVSLSVRKLLKMFSFHWLG